MSKFKIIETQFKDIKSLQKALDEMNVEYEVAEDVKNPTLPLHGYQGDLRKERASVRIDRQFINQNYSNSASNDLGFAWNPEKKVFEAIISEYDTNQKTMDLVNGIRQNYAVETLKKKAKAKGYIVKEMVGEGKVKRLQLVKL